METVESLSRRIAATEDLYSVVKSMKALAAANIKRHERTVRALEQFRETVDLGFRVLLATAATKRISAKIAPKDAMTAAIVIGSDQGMCGQINDQVVEFTLRRMSELGIQKERRVLFAVGVRAASRLADAGEEIATSLNAPIGAPSIGHIVRDVLIRVEDARKNQQVERLLVFYSRLESRASFEPCVAHVLPIDRTWLARLMQQPWPVKGVPMFTMDPDRLFSALVRQYLFVSLYGALAESMASENASRLNSMQRAERNIEERLNEILGRFHQLRQQSITEELLDIVSGFEALGLNRNHSTGSGRSAPRFKRSADSGSSQ